MDDPSNFLLANTSGFGFSISPATGKAISELVMSGKSSVAIDGLRLSRFADVPHNWREEQGWDPAIPAIVNDRLL